MANMKASNVFRHVRTLFTAGTVTGLSDAQLLDQFALRRASAVEDTLAAEAAFEVLVARHGPMVLGVCRRALSDPHEIEDAFQATFLVLVRKAGSVRVGDSLGRWLYGVSRRVAARARVRSQRGSPPDLVTRVRAVRARSTARSDNAVDRPRRRGEPSARQVPRSGRPVPPRGALPRRGCRTAELAGRHGQRAALTRRGLLKDRLVRRGLAPTALSLGAVRPSTRPGPLFQSTSRHRLPGRPSGPRWAVPRRPPRRPP